jgi:hypothetical protein
LVDFSVVLFSVVVLLPVSGAPPLLVVVVVESVDFWVTSGDGAGAAGDVSVPGLVCSVVVVVVVVSVAGFWHPAIVIPAMKANAPIAANEAIFFEIFMGRTYQNFNMY